MRPFLFQLLALTLLPGAAPAEESSSDAPLPPLDAARTMQLPDGFEVTLFAGEPAVRQPIGFAIDDRGRLWVAEAYNYPNHGTRPGDRIVIFEDTDGDGRSDERTVFFDGLNYVSGLEVGFGGAWVMSPPYFYFIADRDGDDRPDGDPELLLDGFGNHANAHNMANGFAWGPDGWLYGTHGRTNWSLPGRPGTPKKERRRFDGGVWRYHPERHVWESYADGTTNPWGIDWNDHGQAFISNCVNPHLFHVIQGAHYEPWRNRKSSQYAFERIPTIADHLHFTGGKDVRGGLGSKEELAAGGGHAHCGLMVYLGDSWPERYRNTVFMNNVHGRRINNDVPRRQGSTYVASHAPDVLISRDPWFMGVTLRYGPDGSVYASDWSDTGECHSTRNTRRETGRIYKITYGNITSEPVDLARRSDAELVELQLHRNDWYVRHARRLLQERFVAGEDLSASRRKLREIFQEHPDEDRKLRALWALHTTGGLVHPFLIEQLEHPGEHVRAWAVPLLCEDRDPSDETVGALRQLAASESSSLVRLHLASALGRTPLARRWPLAGALLAREEDADDRTLSLMLWYGIEPLIEADAERFVALARSAASATVRRHIARRAALADALEPLVEVLGRLEDNARRADVLAGALRGLEGRRRARMPRSWPETYTALRASGDAQVRELARELALTFRDPRALDALRRLAGDRSANAAKRRRALEALLGARPDDLAGLLIELVSDPDVSEVALRGLALYRHPETASTVLAAYESFDARQRQSALQTLAARPAWALAMLDAVESSMVPREDISAFTVRQLHGLDDAHITEKARAVWGVVRATDADRARRIARYRKQLDDDALAEADLAAGHALFQKHCASCHRLFGEGEAVGPDLTGAQRDNLDYLLENIVDPSAAVSRDYQMERVITTDGRVITAQVVASSDRSLTLQTVNERLTLPLEEVASRETSRLSLMPDGLLEPLSRSQVRDLIAFLSGPPPVPQNGKSPSTTDR